MVIQEQKAAAEALGVTPRTLRDWRKNHTDFPDCTAGYDLRAIRDWIATHGAKGSERADQAHSLTLATKAQILRIKKAEADRRERQEQIARGNILPRDEFETALIEIITIARDRLLAIPKTLARLVPRKDQARLQEEGSKAVRKVLEEMERQLETLKESAPCPSRD